LVVGVGEETKRQKFEVIEVNWMVEKTQKVFVRIRHGGKLIKSKVERLKNKVVVEMGEAQRGVAPGQSAVFYSEEGELLGGGVIA
jgi:tRNA U34 2-thiouridine synthase MnmA/TrmU